MRLSKLTACSYLYVIRQFFIHLEINTESFSPTDLNSIKTFDIERFLTFYTGKININGIIYKHSVLKTFFEYFFVRRIINQNITKQIIIGKLKDKPIERLSRDEISKLLQAVNNSKDRHQLRDKTIIMFLLSTGVRVSELIGLDIKDIDLQNASFNVTHKGGKIDTLFMTEELLKQLCIYMKTIDTTNIDAPLFASEDNPRIADNSVRLLLEKYSKVANIQKRVTPHTLRRTFGTNLYRKTRDIFVVSKFLGHSSVNTTRKHYADIDNDIKREAVKGFSLLE